MVFKTSGRCGSAAKRSPHRPGISRTLGLRARSDGRFIVSQTASPHATSCQRGRGHGEASKEKYHVVLFLAAEPETFVFRSAHSHTEVLARQTDQLPASAGSL